MREIDGIQGRRKTLAFGIRSGAVGILLVFLGFVAFSVGGGYWRVAPVVILIFGMLAFICGVCLALWSRFAPTEETLISEDPLGPVITVTYEGRYPSGSGGNDFASEMVTRLRHSVDELNPRGVILDMAALRYSSGDGVLGLALALYDDASESFRPAAVVATGATAEALAPLFEPPWLFGIAGMKLVRSHEEALGQIVQRLNETSMTPGEPESANPLSCRVVADREGNTRWWSFYLINDEDSPLGSAVLDKVCYEWGDQYLETKEPNEPIVNLAPGDRARIWRDDGESETRIDLWLTIKHRGQKKRFVFGFPKLYKQTGNHLDGLGSGA